MTEPVHVELNGCSSNCGRAELRPVPNSPPNSPNSPRFIEIEGVAEEYHRFLMWSAIRKWVETGQHVCPWWLAYSFDNPLRKCVHDPVALFGNLICTGDTVLDLGCGMGHFSIGMARLVGDSGMVIAVDLQERMLSRVRRRAEKTGLASRVMTHLSEPRRIALETTVDFGLAFWMVHEVPDQTSLFRELLSLLRPGALLLIVEPKYHVSLAAFRQMEALALSSGFRAHSQPKVRLSHATLLARP